MQVTKESMISRDARREHGIYLGEMVWALIFAALNKVAYLYPRGRADVLPVGL